MEERVNRLREIMAEEELSALMVTSIINVRYLSGFTGSSGYLLVTPEEYLLMTDSRYLKQAREEAPGCRLVDHGEKRLDSLREELDRLGLDSLAFEAQHSSYAEYERYRDGLEEISLTPVVGLVERLRAKKDEQELHLLRKAVLLADKAFAHICSYIEPGLTEREVALELEFFIREAGAEGLAFPTIVASGPRGAMPHGRATDKRLEQGEMVTMDFGACYQGYNSDITRTLVLGEPTEKQREVYSLVQRAQAAAKEGMQAGIPCQEADALARDIISDAGKGHYFRHSLGHGIGLQAHEAPRISSREDRVLEEGMVVTVEPGVYIPEWGGIRIEDMVLVCAEGVEVLTSAPRELITI